MASEQSQLFFPFAVRWGEKSAAFTVKNSKMQSWENFKQELYSKPTKCSGKPSGVLATKYLIILDPSKKKMMSCSAMRRSWLADGERISKIINPVTIMPQDTQEVYLGKENTITVAAKYLLVMELRFDAML